MRLTKQSVLLTPTTRHGATGISAAGVPERASASSPLSEPSANGWRLLRRTKDPAARHTKTTVNDIALLLCDILLVIDLSLPPNMRLRAFAIRRVNAVHVIWRRSQSSDVIRPARLLFSLRSTRSCISSTPNHCLQILRVQPRAVVRTLSNTSVRMVKDKETVIEYRPNALR